MGRCIKGINVAKVRLLTSAAFYRMSQSKVAACVRACLRAPCAGVRAHVGAWARRRVGMWFVGVECVCVRGLLVYGQVTMWAGGRVGV